MVRSFDAPGVPHDRHNDRYSDTDGDFRQRVRALPPGGAQQTGVRPDLLPGLLQEPLRPGAVERLEQPVEVYELLGLRDGAGDVSAER